MEDSVFTKIIKGEIPCHKVYEDDKTLAFMDIHPALPGHVLVVPKVQIDSIEELPDEDYRALFATVKNVSTQLKQVLGHQRTIILVMGYDVPHAHVHLLPSDTSEVFYAAMMNVGEAHKREPDHEALEKLAERLRF
jgi:histidine triad (HIT) family protein